MPAPRFASLRLTALSAAGDLLSRSTLEPVDLYSDEKELGCNFEVATCAVLSLELGLTFGVAQPVQITPLFPGARWAVRRWKACKYQRTSIVRR